MPIVDRSKLIALEPNLENRQVADPELLQTAITHLFDVMDLHKDQAAAHDAANLTYTGPVGGGTVAGAVGNLDVRVGTLESMGLGPSATVASGAAMVGATASPLPQATCAEAVIQADPANGGYVHVGSATMQMYQLGPGEAVNLKISNLSTIYVRGAADGYLVNYLTRGG